MDRRLVSAALVASVAVVPRNAIGVQVEPVYFPQNGNYYFRVTQDDVCWDTARAAAASTKHLGVEGHLATITTQEEDEFIWDALGGRRLDGHWLGGRQRPGSSEPDGGWAWITGEPWGWKRWASGEPNNDHFGESEEYLQYHPIRESGRWNDMNGCPLPSWARGYVIEYPVGYQELEVQYSAFIPCEIAGTRDVPPFGPCFLGILLDLYGSGDNRGFQYNPERGNYRGHATLTMSADSDYEDGIIRSFLGFGKTQLWHSEDVLGDGPCYTLREGAVPYCEAVEDVEYDTLRIDANRLSDASVEATIKLAGKEPCGYGPEPAIDGVITVRLSQDLINWGDGAWIQVTYATDSFPAHEVYFNGLTVIPLYAPSFRRGGTLCNLIPPPERLGYTTWLPLPSREQQNGTDLRTVREEALVRMLCDRHLALLAMNELLRRLYTTGAGRVSQALLRADLADFAYPWQRHMIATVAVSAVALGDEEHNRLLLWAFDRASWWPNASRAMLIFAIGPDQSGLARSLVDQSVLDEDPWVRHAILRTLFDLKLLDALSDELLLALLRRSLAPSEREVFGEVNPDLFDRLLIFMAAADRWGVHEVMSVAAHATIEVRALATSACLLAAGFESCTQCALAEDQRELMVIRLHTDVEYVGDPLKQFLESVLASLAL